MLIKLAVKARQNGDDRISWGITGFHALKDWSCMGAVADDGKSFTPDQAFIGDVGLSDAASALPARATIFTLLPAFSALRLENDLLETL
jgi:hypothetical protein